MNLIESYKIELELLHKFIEEEEKRGETERVAKALAETFAQKKRKL